MKKIITLTVAFFGVLMIFNENRKDVKTEKDQNQKEKNRTDKPEKFLEFHRGIRTRGGASGPAYTFNYKERELQSLRSNRFARQRNARTKSNGVTEWKERGPGNVPGRTRALYNIPSDDANNTWLAGAATGGIWKTADGGDSWTEKSADFPALPISSFAADEAASVIYAGTGEFVSSIFSAIGNGIFKSTDKGETWTQIASTNNHPDFTIITRIIVHPTNANLILATTVPHNLSDDNTSAIMRSTDGGSSWTKVQEVPGIFEQIIASPENFEIQYASQHSVGIWKSTDGGLSWNLSNDGMSANGRTEIAISPVNPNKVFASSEGTLSGQGADLYMSSDRGESWSLVDVSFNNSKFDFFEGQGFYDNTIMCDPFDEHKVYFGGVSLFRATVTDSFSFIDNFSISENNTGDIIFLQAFANIPFDNSRLDVGEDHDDITVEIRFGPGQTQKAHRFTVPIGATSGVSDDQYTYRDYVDVPFEVWDITNNRQLMASFRDQNRNNNFDLVPSALTEDVAPEQQSREYLYINNINYSQTTANTNIAKAGGHVHSLAYNLFPALAPGAQWDENNLPDSKLVIANIPLKQLEANTITVADGRGSFDQKNPSDQVNLANGVHPDHHTMIPIITDQAQKTYKIVIGNDGGVFVSKVSSNPGTTNGDWQFKGLGLNTSQFYGADKRPGANQYIGGMQDNGTRISPSSQSASSVSEYKHALSGDGFEVLWNSKNPNLILGTVYNGYISRSVNGGNSWQDATTGLVPGAEEFPFVTKLANSKSFPDRVFTVGRQGVYKSDDFGGRWRLVPISKDFIPSTSSNLFLDVEVSRANADIVWAGGGMSNDGDIQRLHVSSDGGKTFHATNNYTVASLGPITKLASHPKEPNTAYALFSFAKAAKILRTKDLGETWEDISGFGSGTSSINGFPDVAVYCLYVRPDRSEIIWAGTEIGIIESLDNGASWALLEEFPNVSVWDMKGQDDQVVIATHGRGIWTATIDESQNNGNAPEVIASGTSPSKDLVLRIRSEELFDSLQIFVGTRHSQTVTSISTGIQDINLQSLVAGLKEVSFIAYKGKAPYKSTSNSINHLEILETKNSYVTYFTSTSDLLINGLTLQDFNNSSSHNRKSLQTNHNYSTDKIYEVLLKTPVKVSSTMPYLYYSDMAIVQPGNDSVVVEATSNGIDWLTLKSSYDASYAGDMQKHWQNAFNNNQPGTSAMFVNHEVDLTEIFAPGENLLFRWRLISGPEVTSWGWAIDYISIQVLPVSIEETSPFGPTLTLYPNPSTSQFTINYFLDKPSEVTLTIADVFGRRVRNTILGNRDRGEHNHIVNTDDLTDGTYLVFINFQGGKQMGKIIKKK